MTLFDNKICLLQAPFLILCSPQKSPQNFPANMLHQKTKQKIMDPLMNAHAFSVMMDDEVMLDCFLNFPKVMPEYQFVLDYSVIADTQNNNNELLTALQEFPDKYS